MEQIVIAHKGHVFEEYNICPFCHVAMKPIITTHAVGKQKDGFPSIFTIIWRCPVDRCERDVVTVYKFRKNSGNTIFYEFQEFLNGTPNPPIWPDFVLNLINGNPDDPIQSQPSKFIDIYTQALSAEFKGLNEISGIGYRRAFEFLVKDYAIMENPNDKDEIIKLQLVPVIKKFFPAKYLPIMERAAWLGNDETHYERKHPDYNIADLKRAITYVISDLDSEKQRQALITGMPKK